MVVIESIVDAIVAACDEIFGMVLDYPLTSKMKERPLPFDLESPTIDDVIASIGITGTYSGTLALYISEEMALDMAGILMEEQYTELNSEVHEAIGEVVNMIAGGIKNRLSSDVEDIFEISLPIVVSGREKRVFHGKNVEQIVTPVETEKGLLFVSLILDRGE